MRKKNRLIFILAAILIVEFPFSAHGEKLTTYARTCAPADELAAQVYSAAALTPVWSTPPCIRWESSP